MAPKKKRTQLKGVERGFATTSIPKKPPPPGTVDEAPEVKKEDVPPPAAPPQPVMDEAELSLQRLVEKYQEKTEKEIQRTLKSIEYERRMAKSLPQLGLDQITIKELVTLAMKANPDERPKASVSALSRDKALAQAGITYGVLRRLKFSEDMVIQCLKEILGYDLEQAFDWLYLRCPEEDLTPEKPVPGNQSKETLTPKTASSNTPRTPKANERANLRQKDDLDSAAQAKAPKPSAAVNGCSTKDMEDDDPNIEYVRLKMRLTDLTGSRRQKSEFSDDMFLKTLKARLEEVKQHYFFREKDAEVEFKRQRKEADNDALMASLRGEAVQPRAAEQVVETVEKKKGEAPLPEPPATSNLLDKDTGDDEQGGGVLGLLEETAVNETTVSEQKTITFVDMALPKGWSGKTPKSLLSDLVSNMDRYAAIVYSNSSKHSKTKKSSVRVRWTSRKDDFWSMEDKACHESIHAQHYIATVALHALTYPSDEGFRSSLGNPKGAQTSFRHLPPAFRDLWNELEIKRKEDENRSNREVWGTLSSLVDVKLSEYEKADDKVVKETFNKDTAVPEMKFGPGYSPEQVQTDFYNRQMTFSYQVMLAQRMALPIANHRQTIMDMLEMSQVIVLSGETGCGKSTQLPTFILEDQLSRGNPCKVVVTEPRRISAISLAQRVSQELGEAPGSVGTNSSLVGYTIRLESQTSKSTRLNFVTNGIALRMLEGGSGAEGRGTAFDEITHIVVDEVHERSIDSDFLLIVLKSLIEQRKDLKVILMSATMDAEKISKYFGGCPTISVPGRTFPVDVRFVEDAVEYTKWSISEKSLYAKRENDRFHQGKKSDWVEEAAPNDDEDSDEGVSGTVKFKGQRYSSNTVSAMNLLDERQIPYELIVRILETVCNDQSYVHMSAAFLVFMPGLGEIRRLADMLSEHPFFGSDAFRIFPLHSTISSEDQSLVFDVPPPGVRKIVIATNIAETGVTIPDITCVIDSGKHREMRFDEKRQISRLIETFVAKSNAAQRRGRAGRVQAGICFHLFSRARYELMAEHPLPEMLRLSLSDLALRIKILKVNLGSSIEDVFARCLDPPTSINVQRAISALIEVQALTSTEEITPMGRLLSKLPTDVHLGKFLLLAALFKCLDPALTIAATLNSKSPFLKPFGYEHEADMAKMEFRMGDSDFLTLHNVFNSWRKASANNNFVKKFCKQYYLSHQNLQQIEELRQQYLGYLVDSSFIKVNREFVAELSRARYSKGYRTRFVTVPPEYDQNTTENMALLNAALCAGLYPKLLILQDGPGGQMKTLSNNQSVVFHPSSVNFRKRPQDLGTTYLNYFTIMMSKRLYAWETGPVDDMAILLLCGDCEFKVIADSVTVDRKIRFRLSPKTSVALKFLRANLSSSLAAQFRGKGIVEGQQRWYDIAMRILSKVKPDLPSALTSTSLSIVAH